MRELDERFLHLSTRQRTKEYFSFVVDQGLRKIYDHPAHFSLLEIGCARGDFLSLVTRLYPHASVTGIDIRDDLVQRAQLDFPHITFRSANLFSLPPDLAGFDCACMLTIHSLFDEIEPALLALLRTVKKGGRVFVFGLFNPAPLDVLVKVRLPGETDHFESGWNIHSEAAVAAFLQAQGYTFSFARYTPAREKQSDDEGNFSSWTQQLADGSLQLINGLQLIHRFALLEITV